MKKILIFLLSVGVLFLGFSPNIFYPNGLEERYCSDFADHIGPNGSDHIKEFGGAEQATKFLRLVSDGAITFALYGNEQRAIAAVTSSPWGPAVIIFGRSVLPTMFPTTTDRLNNLIRGLPKIKGQKDLESARQLFKCFADKIPVPVDEPSPARLPDHVEKTIIIQPAAIVILILLLLFMISRAKVAIA